MPIELRRDEKIIKQIKPHPLAFTDLYSIFLYLIIINILFLIYYQDITNWLLKLPIVGWIPQLQAYLTLTAWSLSIILPFLAIALLKATWKWFILSLIAMILGIIFKFKFQIPEQAPAIIIGLIGLSLVEMYRKGHTYYITNQRIITELKFITQKQKEFSYSKLNELIVKQGIIGRIFNIGTIIPITATSLGLGEDITATGIGATTNVKGIKIGGGIAGGKTVIVPRGRSAYTLFGVKNPIKIKELISKHAWQQEETPILRKIAEDIEKLVYEKEETEKSSQTTSQ